MFLKRKVEKMAEAEPKWNREKQNGTFIGYLPQWKHKDLYATINRRLAPLVEGGEKWTDVPCVTIRGQIRLTLPNGAEIIVGHPFPRFGAGILETIGLYGYEQANALAWEYSAAAASIGASIEVRVIDRQINYDIKTRDIEQQSAAA